MKPSIKLNPVVQAVVALFILLMFAGVLFLPVWRPEYHLDADVRQTLLAMVVLAVGFYLGTSSGAATKDETIAGQLQQQPKTKDTP